MRFTFAEFQMMESDFAIVNDDDLDEHFCLKCKTTIQGLENYVDHRKRKCEDMVGCRLPDLEL